MTKEHIIKFHELTCARVGCHVLFAVTVDMDDRLRETHEDFYCPFGHSNTYPQQTKAEKLEKELSIAKKEIAIREARIKDYQENWKPKPKKRKKKIHE